jgi:hypothetical protein
MRCRKGVTITHRKMGRGGERARAAFTAVLLRGETSMVMQRVTPRRIAVRKLQDQRAVELNELGARNIRSENWREEFGRRGAASGPRAKPTLAKIGFMERRDLSRDP